MISLRTRRALYRSVLFIGDAICVAVSLPLAYQIRLHWAPFVEAFPPVKGIPSSDLYTPLLGAVLVLWLTAFALNRFYGKISLDGLDEILRVARGTATGWILVLAGTSLYRGSEYSRLVLALTAVLIFIFVFLFRQAAKLAYGRLLIK